MPQRTHSMPLDQPLRLIPPQNPLPFLALQKVGVPHLMLRHQEGPARRAVQHVPLGRRPERNLARHAAAALLLGAEDDHVGKVAAGLDKVFLVARVLAEDAAGGEDGVDGVDDDTGWGEGEVAGVVLGWLLA